MRKISMVAALALLVATAAFADTAVIASPMVIGKIKSVNLGSPQTGVKPELVIVDGNGKEFKLSFSDKTAISDKTGKALTSAQLASGEKVSVKLSKGQEADSIQVIS